MVNTLQTRVEEEQVGISDSLDHDEEQMVAEEPYAEDEAPEKGDVGVTAELILHPFNNAIQAVWLCQKLKEGLRAEIVYVKGGPEGTVIRVSIREPVPLVDFLTAMEEVAEAWEEPSATAAPLIRPVVGGAGGPSKVVFVALQPPQLAAELLAVELTRTTVI